MRHARSAAPPDPLAPPVVPSTIDWAQVAAFALLIAHACVVTMLPLTFAVCGYLFTFFKLQSAVYLVLPAARPDYGVHDDYGPLKILLYILLVCQLVHVLKRTWQQCTAGVFLIDWEKGQLACNTV